MYKIEDDDSGLVVALKLLYLLPFLAIIYIPSVIYFGVKECGNPLEIIKTLKSRSKK